MSRGQISSLFPINQYENIILIFLLLLKQWQCFSIIYYVDFFTYNDRYDEENYEYDYPEEGGHEINEEVKSG